MLGNPAITGTGAVKDARAVCELGCLEAVANGTNSLLLYDVTVLTSPVCIRQIPLTRTAVEAKLMVDRLGRTYASVPTLANGLAVFRRNESRCFGAVRKLARRC